MSSLPIGIYERLLDEELQSLLDAHPDLKPILRSIDDEACPDTYAQFVGQLVQKALRISEQSQRLLLVNRLIELLSATDGLEFFQRNRLLTNEKSLLTEIAHGSVRLPRPHTPMAISSLLTGQGADPPLEHELRAEMMSADQVNFLVSFIKWSGLRLLIPAIEHLREKGVPVRILSTSYMGASDPAALEWLAKQENVTVRVSYDTGGTRLHAKAYHFIRKSGYSTAYIGSANMSHSAMTTGLEWTIKVTNQDMPHILDRFRAEFESYWESSEFEPFTEQDYGRFRKAIQDFKVRVQSGIPFFAEITPRPFQLRILEALEAERQRGAFRNLVVAATGTGKTVISALDYKRFADEKGSKPTLLFVVHRKEILEQSLGCFRAILRDQNFGELLVDGQEPTEWRHVFASIQSLNRKQPWDDHGRAHFRYVIVDEAHHGAANSYRPLFDHLEPQILLGLTATPERMDGSSILPDFGGRFAAEIRLPEALEEKLLCPFHYFGISDNVDLEADQFWRNGRYDVKELENVYTGDDMRALQRVDLIIKALRRYQPELEGVRGVGFCAGVRHAEFMTDKFNAIGIPSATLLGTTAREMRPEIMRQFREGKMTFLFAVDVLSEGVDVPEINLVMFLRPTESLTVFLQQLGRGLRHAPEKECLTVLDFVGQTHRKYRLDAKFNALLSRRRQRIDREIEQDFPHLPPGCSIQLERVARERILKKIRTVLNDLNHFIPEVIQTWAEHVDKPLTFGAFLDETGLSAGEVLSKKSWSEWKAIANQTPLPNDPDLEQGKKALGRIALRSDENILSAISQLREPEPDFGEPINTALHYLLWSKNAEQIGISTAEDSFEKWRQNLSLAADAAEIAQWKLRNTGVPTRDIPLPFSHKLQLHAAYGSAEIKTYLGLATLDKSGPTGQGVLHIPALKCYVHLVTFQKDEKDFSPTTRYRDYPISPTQLHWESQSSTTQESPTGQNYIHFQERGYTILFFARLTKQIEGETSPFLFLGPAKKLLSYEGNRPIAMVWDLIYPIPASLFEEARAV